MRLSMKKKSTRLNKIVSLVISFTFTLNLAIPPVSHAQSPFLPLPTPGAMLNTSQAFAPVLLRGITIDPQNPLHFNFIIDSGDTGLKGEQLKVETDRSIRYFLAALTIPESDLWVNLSPYEKDKIVSEQLGVTDLGRDLLAQDYILKQLTASLIYPEEELGKTFWDKVYQKAHELYGTTEIPVNTFNKVWIVPETAVVFQKGNTALAVDSHLKVMLEEDYVAMRQQTEDQRLQTTDKGLQSSVFSPQSKDVNGLGSQIVREVVIPAIEEEVNTGKNFAQLRQIYNAVILAAWFKQNLKDSLLGQVYVDRAKVNGVDLDDKAMKDKIYQQYLEAYKKGVYNYIKEDYDRYAQQPIPRKYFSGGIEPGKGLMNLDLGKDVLRTVEGDPTALPQGARENLARLATDEGKLSAADVRLAETEAEARAIEDQQKPGDLPAGRQDRAMLTGLDAVEKVSRKPILGGNLKREFKRNEINALLLDIGDALREEGINQDNVDVFIAVQDLYIDEFRRALEYIEGQGALPKGLIKIGAQNVSHRDERGAFTGQHATASQLKEMGVEYVIVGHSEVRRGDDKDAPDVRWRESNQLVNKKVLSLLSAGITPVIAVGESAEERKEGRHFDIVREQVLESLEGVDLSGGQIHFSLIKEDNNLPVVLAYEPVWAIGAKALRAATPEEADEMQRFIREIIMEKYGPEVASKLRIQYGGSMKPANVASLSVLANVDGGLIGGAAKKGETFVPLMREWADRAMLASSVDELLTNISGAVNYDAGSGKFVVTSEEELVNTGVDYLVREAVMSADADVKTSAQRILREVANSLGIKSQSIHAFYEARNRGEWSGMTTPAYNVRTGPAYLTMRQIIRTVMEDNVGPFIFELAKSETGYTGQDYPTYAATAYAAAIKEGYRGPLFLRLDHLQIKRSDFDKDREAAIAAAKKVMRDAVAGGVFNPDIDPSALVRDAALGKTTENADGSVDFEEGKILDLERKVTTAFLEARMAADSGFKAKIESLGGLNKFGVENGMINDMRRALINHLQMARELDADALARYYERIINKGQEAIAAGLVSEDELLEKGLLSLNDVRALEQFPMDRGTFEQIRALWKEAHADTFDVTMELLRYARNELEVEFGLKDIGMPLSMGVEVMHVDNALHKKFPSTVLSAIVLMEQVNAQADKEGLVRPSTLSLQSGTSHGLGGDNVFWGIYVAHEAAREAIGVATFSQHGTSTVAPDQFKYMPVMGSGDAHLATEYQKMAFKIIAERSPKLRAAMAAKMRELVDGAHSKFKALLEQAYADKTAEGLSEDEVTIGILAGTFGSPYNKLKDLTKQLSLPFVADIYRLMEKDPALRAELEEALYKEFKRINAALNVVGTKDTLRGILPFDGYQEPVSQRPAALAAALDTPGSDRAMLGFRADEKLPGGDVLAAYGDVLNTKTLGVLAKLAPLSEKLEALRTKREENFIARQTSGTKLNFLPETNPDGTDALIPGTNITVKDARSGNFDGAAVPADLQRQWIQLTGPAAKSPQDLVNKDGSPMNAEQARLAHMRNIVHALTSGADGMMFDGEDALGQLDTMSLDNVRALATAYKKDPDFWKIAEQVIQKDYIDKGKKSADWNWRELIEKNFTARIYRVRGVHLDDRHISFTKANGERIAVSATIADMVTYLVNAGPVLMAQGSTPTLYLPKLQTAEEAAFMAQVIDGIEDEMGWERGTVKVFVLIEQLEETFQLMEIRAALGKHFVGFNTGRWDYIADVVKQNMKDNNWVPPNFKEMTMTYPFMLNYEGRVVRAVNTPDKNGNRVLWIGGMEPQIPVVKGTISAAEKAAAIENAMKIAENAKLRELRRGASGTWVAHPGMVERLRKVYEKNLFEVTGKVNQIGITENMDGEQIGALDYTPEAAAKLIELKPGARTIAELRFLVSVGIQYANAYLTGRAAAALKGADLFDNPLALFIMEDMATGEGRTKLSRKWMLANAEITEVTEEDTRLLGIESGAKITRELMEQVIEQEYEKLKTAPDDIVFASSKTVELPIAAMLVKKFLLSDVDLPWLIDLTNMALNEPDLEKATAKVQDYIDTYKSSGGLIRLTQNPVFDQGSDRAMLGGKNGEVTLQDVARWMNGPRFERVKKYRTWSPQEVFDVMPTINNTSRVHNALALDMFEQMKRNQETGAFTVTGGVMDGPSAAALAEAGMTALYLSGWQASHHWGQPDLAKYPLDTVPNVVERIYKFLENKDQDQRIRVNKMRPRIERALRTFVRTIIDGGSQEEVFNQLRASLLDIVKSDIDIFVNDFRGNPEGALEKLIQELAADSASGLLNAQKSEAVQQDVFAFLESNLVNYLIPIFADGDTGHESIKEMIRLYANAGAASIHLEDQAHGLKKCGHMAGKVLVSMRTQWIRLMGARKEADKLGSNMVIIARTDAEAAKLLQSNEDQRDHYFIKGTTDKDLPSLGFLIRLVRREVEEFDQRADNEVIIAEMNAAYPGVNEAELRELLSPKTPEQLVAELAVKYPSLAEGVREIWDLRGEVEGKRLEPNALLKFKGRTEVVEVETIWANRDAIELDQHSLKLDTVFVDEDGNDIAVKEILARKPAHIDEEIKGMQRLTEEWGQLAKLRTYAQAVADAIDESGRANAAELKAAWLKATNPLENTLSLDQMKQLAKTLGVEIAWDWNKARTYEGYYQIEAKAKSPNVDINLGVVNAVVRSRVMARIADSVWMEQGKPNLTQARAFVDLVNADSDAKGVFFSVNLSPSFNWSDPDGWADQLSEDVRQNIKAAVAVDGFDWKNPETWGEHTDDVQAMLNVIMSFSSDMGKLGFVFQFVTIFQDHVSTLAIYEKGKALKKWGAGGFATRNQQVEQAVRSRFVTHQTAAGVKRVTAEDDLTIRGASALGAAGKDSTENQFKQGKVDRAELGSKKNPGGIDFTDKTLNLQIKRDKDGVPLSIDLQPIQTMNIDGLMPVIIQITPIINLPLLMGMEDKEEIRQLSMLDR